MSEGRLDLEIVRVLAAPRAKVWRAWSRPDLVKEWWCPRPWQTEVKAFDFRSGGAFHTYMTGPDGGASDNPGVFLDVVPMERIVWTSALVAGWRPGSPWLAMTGVFLLADEGSGTRYTARCLHRDDADCRKHEELGFFDGWNATIGQLEAFARALPA